MYPTCVRIYTVCVTKIHRFEFIKCHNERLRELRLITGSRLAWMLFSFVCWRRDWCKYAMNARDPRVVNEIPSPVDTTLMLAVLFLLSINPPMKFNFEWLCVYLEPASHQICFFIVFRKNILSVLLDAGNLIKDSIQICTLLYTRSATAAARWGSFVNFVRCQKVWKILAIIGKLFLRLLS